MSKSRNEKKPPAQPPPVTTTNDIIPGKFNENQWNAMIEQENSQDFVLDLLDEILDCTVQVIHYKYIQSQLQPYSVHAAKDLLLQIIESRFLKHDPGEVSQANDITWQEDEEPVPCVIDSWSQGSVPVQRCESRPLSARAKSRNITRSYSETTSPDASPRSKAEERNETMQEEEPLQEQVEASQTSCESDLSLSVDIVPSPPPTSRVTSPGRRKRGLKTTGQNAKQSNKKKIGQNETPKVLEETTTDPDPRQLKTETKPLHQIRTSRARPGEQEVTHDEQGNIVAMMRLSVDKLPTHRIRPRYDIVDPHTMQSGHLHAFSNHAPRKTTRKDGGVNHLRNRQGELTDIKKESSSFKSPAVKSSISVEIPKKDSDMVKPLPPPLADSMDISAGVAVREGQLVRKGPELFSAGRHNTQTDILNLQPVGSLAKRQTISVSDVIGNSSPVIRQMRLHEPIPPIAHRS